MPRFSTALRLAAHAFVVLTVLATVGTLAGCKKPKGPRRCYTAADCASNEICVELSNRAHTCLDRCDSADSPTCVGGESCVGLPAEDAQVDVCLPGGDVAEYEACDTSVECIEGAVCIQRTGMANARCEKLCEVGAASTCMGSQACTAIDAAVSTTRGTCIVP